jgi:V8-like Glu-specific endopeptidase
MKFRKAIAGIVTLAMTMCSAVMMPSASIVSHADQTVILGDANDSGDVTLVDSYYINSYLGGLYHPTQRQFTAMDINEDGIVDKIDADLVFNKVFYVNTFTSKSFSSLYTLPSDSATEYYKHTYGTTPNTTHYSIATNGTITILDNNVSLLSDDNAFSFDIEEENTRYDSGYTFDDENYQTAKVFTNTSMASGFVVGSNVIATSAHCVMSDGQFNNYVYVRVHEAQYSHTGVIAEGYAASVHVPYYYLHPDETHYQGDYDYALIYIEETESGQDVDLSDCAVNIGVMSNVFAGDSNKTVNLSGYSLFNDGNDFRRYMSSGNMYSTFGGQCYRATYPNRSGLSGGMVYKDTDGTYTHNGEQTLQQRTALGINRANAGSYAVGVRFNPTLLRFYFQNSSNLS